MGDSLLWLAYMDVDSMGTFIQNILAESWSNYSNY
jgi:hypothetical protein